jgi:dihydroorotase-like cyclic amidohydrolase
MSKISKEIGTRNDGKLGMVEMEEFTSIEEAVERFGETTVCRLFNRSLHGDYERVAREALKAGKPEDEVQAMIDSYQPGTRTGGKPSAKKLLDLFVGLVEAGKVELMQDAHGVYASEGVDAAFEYLKENGVAV